MNSDLSSSANELSEYNDDVPSFEDQTGASAQEQTSLTENQDFTDTNAEFKENDEDMMELDGELKEISTSAAAQSDEYANSPDSQESGNRFRSRSPASGQTEEYSSPQPIYSGDSELEETSSARAPPIDIPNNILELVMDKQVEKYEVEEGWTYGDLRQKLQNSDYDITKSHSFYDDYTDEKLEDDLPVVGGKRVTLRWHLFTITVQDCDWSVGLTVASNFSIEKIKEEVEQRHGRNLQSLSYNGKEIPDQQQLRDIATDDETRLTLIGHISVVIIDDGCKLQTDIDCPPFWNIETLVNQYLEKAQRSRHDNFELILDDKHIENDQDKPLHAFNIVHGSVLLYHVPEYDVKIFDHDADAVLRDALGNTQATILKVQDQLSVKAVMEQYARQTGYFFNENDYLLMGTRKLDKHMQLWQLRFRADEELSIQREEKAMEMTYTCMSCGFEVKLKREEPVQCHHCFMRILLKKRTTRVCQYNCR